MITILHQNVRSLIGKSRFENICHHLSMIPEDLSIIVFTETWLKEELIGFFNIDGYNKEFYCRPHERGGGILMFIKNEIDYTRRFDLTMPEEAAESITITIRLENNTNVFLGAIHRPPQLKRHNFALATETLLEKTQNLANTILIGDMNINALSSEEFSVINDVLEALSMKNIIDVPTRPSSQTCLDHVYLKGDISYRILTDIESDHQGIIITIPQHMQTNPPSKHGIKLDLTKFELCVKKTDWNDILKQNDVDNCYNSIISALLKCQHEASSTRLTTKVTSNPKEKNPLDFLTESIIHELKLKKNIYRKWQRAKLRHLLGLAKRCHKAIRRPEENSAKPLREPHLKTKKKNHLVKSKKRNGTK